MASGKSSKTMPNWHLQYGKNTLMTPLNSMPSVVMTILDPNKAADLAYLRFHTVEQREKCREALREEECPDEIGVFHEHDSMSKVTFLYSNLPSRILVTGRWTTPPVKMWMRLYGIVVKKKHLEESVVPFFETVCRRKPFNFSPKS